MVTVTDPSYPDQPLFEYDIGANCPEQFKLDFTIPTRGPDNHGKHFRVQIHDTFRTIHMNVFRPAPNISQDTLGKNIPGTLKTTSTQEARFWIYFSI